MDKIQHGTAVRWKNTILGGLHHMAKGALDAEPAINKAVKCVAVATIVGVGAVMATTASVALPLPLAIIAYVCGSVTVGGLAAAVVAGPAKAVATVGACLGWNVFRQTARNEHDIPPRISTNAQRVGAALLALSVAGTGYLSVDQTYGVLRDGFNKTVKSYVYGDGGGSASGAPTLQQPKNPTQVLQSYVK